MDTLKRTIVAIPLLALMVMVIMSRSIFYALTISSISCIAQIEMFLAFRKAGYRPCVWTCITFAVLMYPVHVIFGFKVVFMLFVLLVSLGLVWAIFLPQRKFIDIIISTFIMSYPALPFYFLMLIGSIENRSLSIIAMGIALIMPVANDTAAYFVGKFFGKHKLSPMISPKKTVEGAIGGFVFGVIVAVVGSILVNRYANVDISWVHLLICSAIGSVFAQTGDLVASAIKRFVGIKDFGYIFPGHGGIMDRADSILMCAVAVYTYFSIFIL